MKKIYSFIFLVFLFSLLTLSSVQAGIVPCGPGTGKQYCELCDIFKLIDNVIKFLLVPDADINGNIPLVPIIAILMVTVGGFMFVLGNSGVIGGDNVSRAKSLFKSVVIGLLIAYGAWLLIHTFLWAISANNQGSWNTICK